MMKASMTVLNVFRVAVALASVLMSFHASAQCPQYRETQAAPDDVLWQENPLTLNRSNLKAGKRLYRGKDGGGDCVKCHGKKGDGNGLLAKSFAPPPRNFTCVSTMAEIPDGQLFWVIRHGAAPLSMPEHPQYTDEQIWQIVFAIRDFAEN